MAYTNIFQRFKSQRSVHKAVSPYERGVMRGAMRSVMVMRDECLHMRVINLSALRCPRNFTDCILHKL